MNVCVMVCQSCCHVALTLLWGEKKDSWEMGDGVCEVAKEEEWGDGVLVGERAGGDECVLTV